MELIINFSLRGAGRADTVETLIIRDLYAKEPEDATEEIQKQLPDILDVVYEELYP